MKVEHNFIIPVLTDDIKKFTQKNFDDELHPIVIAEKFKFIISNFLNKYGIKTPPLFDDAIQELIENCYDSYAKKGLVIGEALEIKLVLENNGTQVFVKIKDNGSGFANKEKGALFMVADIEPEQKEKDLFFGGEGIGLKTVQAQFVRAQINLFFKNRKTAGATTCLTFPLLEGTVSKEDTFELKSVKIW